MQQSSWGLWSIAAWVIANCFYESCSFDCIFSVSPVQLYICMYLERHSCNAEKIRKQSYEIDSCLNCSIIHTEATEQTVLNLSCFQFGKVRKMQCFANCEHYPHLLLIWVCTWCRWNAVSQNKQLWFLSCFQGETSQIQQHAQDADYSSRC